MFQRAIRRIDLDQTINAAIDRMRELADAELMKELKPKRVMFAHVARMAQAFASPVRVEIIDLLVQAPRSVEGLAGAMEQSRANASQHLQALRGAGLVTTRRDGKNIIYGLSDDVVLVVYEFLSLAADRLLAEAALSRQALYVAADPLAPVSVDELPNLLDRESALLLDVRPALEYQHDHIPRALSFPVQDLPKKVSRLPRGRPIIAYCRGPHCTYAYEAVETIRAAGRQARRLAGGYLGWRVCQLTRTAAQSICSTPTV